LPKRRSNSKTPAPRSAAAEAFFSFMSENPGGSGPSEISDRRAAAKPRGASLFHRERRLDEFLDHECLVVRLGREYARSQEQIVVSADGLKPDAAARLGSRNTGSKHWIK
jgi:hypothetical protein